MGTELEMNSNFQPIPYLDETTDRIRFLFEDRRAHNHFVNSYLSVYLAVDDGAVIGIELRSVSNIIKAIADMGLKPICDPVELPDGSVFQLDMLVRQATVQTGGEEYYEKLNQLTRGIPVSIEKACQ